MTANTLLSNRFDALMFLIGKVLRFLFFLSLIWALFQDTSNFLGYDRWEFILIFLTFNVVDLMAQVLFRGVYFFPEQVIKGNFDFSLVKPMSSLFAALARLDPLDTLFIAPIFGFTIYAIFQIPDLTFVRVVSYVFFLIFGVAISTSFHVISAATTIHYPDNNGFIWAYREIFGLSRFPQETFPTMLRTVFTFVVPAFIIATYPVKVLLGRLSLPYALLGALYGIVFFGASLLLWRWSLKKYSSASS